MALGWLSSTRLIRRATALGSRCSAASISSSVERVVIGPVFSVGPQVTTLRSDRRIKAEPCSDGVDLVDPGDALGENALDPGFEGHRRQGATPAGTDHLQIDGSALNAQEDEVAAIAGVTPFSTSRMIACHKSRGASAAAGTRGPSERTI